VPLDLSFRTQTKTAVQQVERASNGVKMAEGKSLVEEDIVDGNKNWSTAKFLSEFLALFENKFFH
jgi:hypothetical protein